VRDWLVGGGIVASEGGLLLVRNRRRDGRVDWTPPGGVIDEGETLRDGLTREVAEETGLRVTHWRGPAYRVEAEAPDMAWRLRVEVHVAVTYEGDLHIDDPDGIVETARFVATAECGALLDDAPRWVREPVSDWLADPWDDDRTYRYRVDGTTVAGLRVARLDPD